MKPLLHNSDVIYPELSYSIVGAAMDVHNALGPGWHEWDYHRAMIEALRKRGHAVVSHDRKSLVHRGEVVDHFELDLLVDDSVILELKHIKSVFHPEHYVQIINYLKRWEKRLGILINYGLERLSSQRVPYDSASADVHVSGKWEELRRRMPVLCDRVIQGVDNVLALHDYGYGTDVFRKLLVGELAHLGCMARQAVIRPALGELVLDQQEVACIDVDSKLLVSVSATGSNASSSDLAYLKSYMKHAGIPCGIVIDVGNPEIQLKGVL
ncbi:GxxExxY protein [Pontiella sp.]|uniref:GxxExxY protein n=1 Tax=Pontiella sp. TaxID=2837462 RepID=UPI003564BAFB